MMYYILQKKFPAIYSYSVENMKHKMEDMVLFGYSRDEVIKMIKLI